MAINKSFWITDDKKKLNKNFWVKEPVKNLASVQTTQSQASLSADNVQSRIAELDNLMRETDLKIRQQAKYTPEERSEFQRQYGAYNKEYYSLKKELEAMNPVKIERPTISEDIPKTYISNKVQQSAGNKVANFFKTTVPEVAEDVWDNIKEPFTGPSLKQVMTEAKLSPKLLVEDAKIQMEKEDPTREDYALVKQTQEAIRKYGMPDSNVRAITEDTSTLQEQLKRAEKTWQVSPIDAAVANIGAGGAGFLGDVAGFTNMLGADKVPVLKDINNAIISTAEVLQENAQDYNVGTYGNYLGNLTQVITRMVPYFLAGTGKAVTEGSKVAKVVLSTLKNPSFWVSLTTMAGQKYNENMNNGVDRGKSTLNALLYAIPAALVEVQGGIGAQGKEAQSLLKTIIEENFEEISQDIIEGTADKITTKKDMPVYSTSEDAIINPKEMLESVLYTTPATFLTGGVSRAYNNRIANIAENQRVQAQINQDIQNYKNGSDVTKYIPQSINKNEMLRIQSENVNNFPKNNAQKSSQTQNIQQDNVTLPTQAEMAQRANVSEIEEDKQNSIINKINNNQYLSQKEKNELISTVNTTNITPEVEAEINNILNTVNAEFGLKNITNDFNANKSNYTKYFNDKTDIDSSYINNAKSAVNTSDGRRTKDQWLSVAKSLGSQIYEMSDADVEKYAYRTWIENRPNNAQNLNRQGKKYVKFGLDEWVNTVYDSVREARNRIIPTNENPLPTQRVQETLQSAKLAGMTDMDIKRVTDLHKMLQSGTNLRFYDPQNIPQGVDIARAADANGFYQNGTLWLNKNSEMKVERILGHELTHHVENDDLINTILDSNIFYDFLSEKGFSNTTEFKNYLMEKKGYKQHELNSEMVAHFAEEKLFGKEETINRIARENRTIAQKILNWLSDLRTKIAGSTEAKELLRIENMYRKALEQARSMTNTSNISYSIGENVNGQFVKVDTDQDIFDGINEKDYNKIAKMYIKDYLIGDTPLGIEGDIATIDSKTANKYTNPGKKQKYFNEKMKLTPELKNVLQIAKKDSNAKPIKENSKYANWEYYTVNFEIAGRMFECTLNIGVDSNGGKHLYEINKIHPVSILQTSANRSNEMYSNNSIPQNENIVNVEYSLNNKNDTADGQSAFSLPEIKQKQLEIIQKSNPVNDDYHTWVRDVSDIKTFEEALQDSDYEGWESDGFAPDYTGEMAKQALKSGKVTVYSSYPIEQGVFVTPSKMEAKSYAGSGEVYSKTVDVRDIAWIDPTQGQYAKVKGTDKVSFSLPETDNQGRTLSKEQQEFFKDSKLKDDSGQLISYYHGTQNGGFNTFEYGKQKGAGKALGDGFYFSQSKSQAQTYASTEEGVNKSRELLGLPKKEVNSQVYEVYLNAKNPLYLNEYKGELVDKADYIAEKYLNIDTKNDMYRHYKDYAESKLETAISMIDYIKSVAERSGKTTAEIFKDLGYDALVDGKFQTVVFDSNQIKNVDNTNPTSNPDIRYSMNPVNIAKNPPNPQNGLLEEIAPINEKELENVEEKERVASVLTRSPKRPAKDLLKQSKDVFMRKIVDAGHTIDTVGKLTGDKYLYQYYNNTKQARQSAEYMIGEAQTDIRGNRVGNSLIRIFESVRAKGDDYTNKFFEYLLHMHNIDRMAQNKPVFGESVTAEDSSRYVKELLEKYPEFEKQANKVYAYNKNLMQWRVDSGLISREQADLMNQMYPHYVPTFRDVSGTSGSRVMQNTVQISNTVRKAKGGNQDIMPIDASMARQTMQTVQAAKRNLLGNRLLNDVLKNKDRVGEYVQAVEKVNEKNDVETEMETPKDTNLDSNNNVFKIFRNGETYVMKVNNGIYEGLKSISSEIDNTDTAFLLKPVKAANNMFKQLITGYSPMFTIRNFARDIQDAGLYSKDLKGFLEKYPKAYGEMIGNGKMWQLYKSLGGTGSSFFDYETGIEKTLDTQNKASTKIKDATVGKIEELNMMIEQAPRFAEFMATIEKAGNTNYDTLMEAMLNAADITVNFGRSGTWGKALNSTFVPFLNPSIQGFDKFTRTILESRDGKQFAKLAVRATLLGILPSVINELLYWDDDEYENLTDRDKDTNFLIKVGENKWLKIPKGRVLSIFGNTANRVLKTIKDEEWDFDEYVKNQVSQTAPISVFDSNLYSPIQAVQNNKTWYGSDIVPQRLQDYAPKDQYDENTDIFSKWLGGKINYPPKKINYLIDAYTGIIGDVVLPLTTPKAEINPFTKAFVLDGVSSNEISNDFYKMMDKYNTKQNPKKSAKEVSRYLNKQSKQVSDIFKQIREIENSEISDAEKRKQVRELRELANTIELTAMAIVPEYEKAVDKYRGTFSDEDVDSEYAYLYANRDIFGSEYAVKTFSKALYNNHKKENMDKFFKSYFDKQYFQKKIEPEKSKGNALPTLAEQRAKLPSLKK